MKHFSYKGGCGMHGHTRIEVLKRRAGLGCGFRLLVLKCYLKNNYTTKKLKNKVVLNLKHYCMHCYVALSYVRILINVYEDVYPIFKQGATKKDGQLNYKVC